MRIVLALPFGGLTKEAGILHVFAAHLLDGTNEVFQLRCNGVFGLCDRDSESNWMRRLHACSNCSADQKGFASWAGIPSIELSRYLKPAEIIETKRLIAGVADSQVSKIEVSGINVYELCLGSFHNRFGPGVTPDLKNKQHDQFMRRLMLSAYRMCLAVKRFHLKHQPDMVFAPGGDDYMSKCWIMQSKASSRDVAVFKTDLASRAVKIAKTGRSDFYSCELLLQGVEGLRPDKATWPKEVTGILEGIRKYLDISEGQLSIPLAR